MGWFSETAPGHEGFLVAVAREEERSADGEHVMRSWYRELTGLVHDEAAQRRYNGARVSILQVACDCGWRSMRLSAPLGTTWAPCAVRLPRDAEAFDLLALDMWTAHVREHGGVYLYDGAPGPVASVRYRFDRYVLELRR